MMLLLSTSSCREWSYININEDTPTGLLLPLEQQHKQDRLTTDDRCVTFAEPSCVRAIF